MDFSRRQILLSMAAVSLPASAKEDVSRLLERYKAAGWHTTALGVTRAGEAIPAIVAEAAYRFEDKRPHIVIVAGLDGTGSAVEAAAEAFSRFRRSRWKDRVLVSVVPVANPEAWRKQTARDLTGGYPPAGDYYLSPDAVEAQYLWRWLGQMAPDLVLILSDTPSSAAGSLAATLGKEAAAEVGTIAARHITPASPDWLDAILAKGLPEASEARARMRQRIARDPVTVARQLSKVYGHELPSAVYIPAVALMGRLYLDDVAGDSGALSDVERIVAPYREGREPSLPEKPSPSHFSGHLVFGELALRTKNPEYIRLVRAAADFALESDGTPKEAMPFHNEMSDGVFMGGPILALAGRLTGEKKYWDASWKNQQYFARIVRRPDGLYRHSPLDDAAWGRGNAFPALGLALTLEWLGTDHAGYKPILEAFRSHMSVLKRYQDRTGAWHQVVDHPESYRELSATAMVTFSLVRGMRRGWLKASDYGRTAEHGWYAVKSRVREDGHLIDVCTSTGKQKSLRDYLDRIALLGVDPRGGAMTLLVATEVARWQSKR